MSDEIEYGDIYWVSFAPSVGHEFQGKRPAMVVQSNKQLLKSNLVTVIPLTSQVAKAHKDDVLVAADRENNLFTNSLAKVHNISSFDRSRFVKKIGRTDVVTLTRVQKYLRIHFGL